MQYVESKQQKNEEENSTISIVNLNVNEFKYSNTDWVTG